MNRVAFSTLACPEWSIETVIETASALGYDGIEWRGGAQGHVRPELSIAGKAHIRHAVAEAGLTSLAVTTYTSFVSGDPAERQNNVDVLRRYVDLAANLGASYVRAFLGELAPGTSASGVYRNIIACLESAAIHAHSAGVAIAVEPHDDFVLSSSVTPILQQIDNPALGVVWDVANAYAAGEDPAEGFRLLGLRIGYVQLKDGRGHGEDWQLTPLGAGDVPLKRAIELLLSSGYDGAFSVEWERAWHPELDTPDVALPSALRVVRGLLADVKRELVQGHAA